MGAFVHHVAVLTPIIRRILACTSLFLALTAITACATDSPPKHQERLRKAAGIRVFYIDCTKELWNTTTREVLPKEREGRNDPGDVTGVKLEKGRQGLSRVKLSGPELADYLRILDFRAHPPTGDGEAEAVRMYDEIAEVLDGIKTKPAVDDPPPLVVQDGYLPGSAPAKNGDEQR